MNINNRLVENNLPPYIVAEISANHCGSLSRMIELIEAISCTGADAIKIQTYTADDMTFDIRNKHFTIDLPGSSWHNMSLYDLYSKGSTPYEWHEAIFKRAAQLGITVFSTPFSLQAVDFLQNFDTPAYKIASFECNHIELIKHAAKTHKPIIISTGTASLCDVERAVNTVYDASGTRPCLLVCTSEYPAQPQDATLHDLRLYSDKFSCPSGLSDHTKTDIVPIIATTLGACMIEKHVKLYSDDQSIDTDFSLTVKEFESLVYSSKLTYSIINKSSCNQPVHPNSKFNRSLYYSKDLPRGHILTTLDVSVMRPFAFLNPHEMPELVSRELVKSVERGQPVHPDHFES